jgi:hypothetical protein
LLALDCNIGEPYLLCAQALALGQG